MKSMKHIIKSKILIESIQGGGGRKTDSICKYVPCIMALTYIVIEKYKISEAYHKVNEAKTWVKVIHVHE